MTLLSKMIFFLGLLLSQNGYFLHAHAARLPAIEAVLQKGFPIQKDDLAKQTEALYQEHKRHKNIASLIFYSYGLLLQAKQFTLIHDYINAAEYSRTAFFYLDEAADTHEDNPRVRYLRARVDAWLPVSSGRCVITLKDTEYLIGHMHAITEVVSARINIMRDRALFNCRQQAQAEKILQQINTQNTDIAPLTAANESSVPAWDMREINEVVMPLLKDE
ncbi:hypothetical protein [Vagococcus sp. WN89Y]|uniref:hypothetical protein n=1 Tax=Vagococcus sp. WN89Y TaxID=3457258 RepID=UPI003FCD0401